MKFVKYSLLLSANVFFFYCCSFGYSDSIPEKNFKHPFEAKVLKAPDSADYVDLLLAIGNDMDVEKASSIQSKLTHFYKTLKNKNFYKKSAKKKIKTLFKLTHKQFFDKYEVVANFDLIFSSKTYNCVSATALYALILEHFNIPYSIKEDPAHVYLVAYPSTLSIVLESTAPQDGYYLPTHKDINKAVEQLVEMKFITEDELEQKGAKTIYNEFFYGNEEISIRQLAGLQYYNEAIKYLTQEKYPQSFSAVKKAELLYSSKKTEYLKYMVLGNILHNTSFENMQEVYYLTDYLNLEGDNYKAEQAYNQIVQNKLFKQGNVAFVDSVFQYFVNNLNNSEMRESVSENHYFHFSRYYYQLSEYDKAIDFALKAYQMNDKNVNTKSIIAECIVRKLSFGSGSISTINELNDYKQKLPFLKKNKSFMSLYFYNCSFVAYNHLQANEEEKGFKYLNLCEELFETHGKNIKLNENQFAMVYAEAGAYYYREKQYVKAKNIIEKGMRHFPDHPELKARLKIVSEEL